MLKKFYDIILSIEHFNPYGFSAYDINHKLKTVINGKKIIVSGAKSVGGEWHVQMIMSDGLGDGFDDYKYFQHEKVSGQPSLFTLLIHGNKMIENWDKLSSEG